jgi:uncharacterized membrane-anchored protein
MRRSLLLLCLCLTFPVTVLAVAPSAPTEAAEETSLIDTFDLKTGTVELSNGMVKMEVPDGFRYIGPEDSKRFLEEGWGNPDGSGTLGMLLPVETDLFGDEGWGVVITYQDDGHVADEDAADIDYKELLGSMQEETTDSNEERKKLGFEPVTLVGWATPPRYDAQTKKLYWAKELQFGDNKQNTLNYNVRILGRSGVLVMNAVSGMSQLAAVEKGMVQVLGFTEFKEGQRYSDFDSSSDKLAGYGIAALVGGGIAAKAGLFAKLGAVLLAFKKLIFVGLAAVGAFVIKLFSNRKKSSGPVAPDGATPPDEPSNDPL